MDYQIKYLLEKLKAVGLPSSWHTIKNWERLGKLKLRRRPNGWRVVSAAEANEIITAMSPGGSGRYFAKHERPQKTNHS